MVRKAFTVALAAVGLVVSGAGIAIGGQAGTGLDSPRREATFTKGVRNTRQATASKTEAPVVAERAPVAEKAPSPPGPPSQAGPPAGFPPPVAGVVLPPTARAPLGLSKDAPETPPAVGVGRGPRPGSTPSPAATPEPTTLLLMGAGIAGLYGLRRRR